MSQQIHNKTQFEILVYFLDLVTSTQKNFQHKNKNSVVRC
jgi:hypothetical protein